MTEQSRPAIKLPAAAYHDPNRVRRHPPGNPSLPPSLRTQQQPRVVRPNRPGPNQDRIARGPKLINPIQILRPRENQPRLASVIEVPVKRHRATQHHIRPPHPNTLSRRPASTEPNHIRTTATASNPRPAPSQPAPLSPPLSAPPRPRGGTFAVAPAKAKVPPRRLKPGAGVSGCEVGHGIATDRLRVVFSSASSDRAPADRTLLCRNGAFSCVHGGTAVTTHLTTIEPGAPACPDRAESRSPSSSASP
jgi:hypothetical protein